MNEFKPIVTQEELDRIVRDRLKREREKVQKAERKKALKVLLNLAAVLRDAIYALSNE